ncbi:MAG: glycine cleavage system protein H [Acidobacteria bacterium]|nr:glycine cleavage system protein H [Acidobacteriota bacterium]MBI3663617.1 glycine cleavage system protein H [Acidobacteriota bacterium]
MTVILVLATFAVLLTIEYFMHRERTTQPVIQTAAPKQPRIQPEFVAGFALPENLRYHPGHTWALSESPNLVRVGIDDFAARLAGSVAKIRLPQRGQWVRQGQKILTLLRDGAAAEMVSPMEGIVTDVNEAVLLDPELARRDPYGEGWLVKLNAPDAKLNFRNLLGGMVARRWMEEAAARLRYKIGMTATALAQDGGVVVEDVSRLLSDKKWTDLTQEFFLS